MPLSVTSQDEPIFDAAPDPADDQSTSAASAEHDVETVAVPDFNLSTEPSVSAPVETVGQIPTEEMDSTHVAEQAPDQDETTFPEEIKSGRRPRALYRETSPPDSSISIFCRLRDCDASSIPGSCSGSWHGGRKSEHAVSFRASRGRSGSNGFAWDFRRRTSRAK